MARLAIYVAVLVLYLVVSNKYVVSYSSSTLERRCGGQIHYSARTRTQTESLARGCDGALKPLKGIIIYPLI
jgi:hypothetical protein